MKCDIVNMLCMFDECLTKVIESLEKGDADKALSTAQKAQKGFRKALGQELRDAEVIRTI